jgi:hypothetical protein
VGTATINGGIIAGAGEIHREFQMLRRKRALFHLSLEGTNSLMLTTQRERYVVAASYEDNGYRNEPLRAKVITMTNMGVSREVPFTGSTPNDLIDAMISAYDELDASEESKKAF